MAVSFSTQVPTTPNAAYTRLGTMVESTDVSLPQYQYIMDVYESGSSDYIARLTQTPSAYNMSQAIFDPSRIFQGELGFDNNWKVTGSIQPVNSLKTFELKIGEQYGTSPSSSVTVYPNQASMSLEVFPGVVNPVEKESIANVNAWNFDTNSFEGQGNPYLTNDPAAQTIDLTPNNNYAYMVNSTDYMTVTVFQDNFSTPGYIVLNGSKIVNGSITPVLQDALTFPSSDAKFTTLGIGPQNMADYLLDWKTAIDNGDINLIYSTNDPGGFAMYINDLWDGVPAVGGNGYLTGIRDPLKQCSDEYTRFAFINKYGFWDYYNVYNPVRTTTALERETYNKTQINYNPRALFTTGYYGYVTGKSQYFLRSTDTYSIDTDYIDKQTANWLEELLESPEVFIQEGSDFVPIVITNNTYDHNNSTSRNKLFNYTIEWVYANPRSSRL